MGINSEDEPFRKSFVCHVIIIIHPPTLVFINIIHLLSVNDYDDLSLS